MSRFSICFQANYVFTETHGIDILTTAFVSGGSDDYPCTAVTFTPAKFTENDFSVSGLNC
jgi:hypothetical protein